MFSETVSSRFGETAPQPFDAVAQRQGLLRLLATTHGEDSLLRAADGELLPALARPLNNSDPDVLLGRLLPDEQRFTQTGPELESLQRAGAKLWNGPTYVLRGFDDEQHLVCSTGRYFDAVNTCFELRTEIQHALARCSGDPSEAWNTMPMRRALFANRTGPELNEWLWRGEGRSASLSISCLLLVRDTAGFRYGVARRAADVSDEPGLNHVVPSMAFQPVDDDARSGYDITDTVLRELAEELFSVPEGSDWRAFPAIRDLKTRLADGRARHRLTGIVMNLEDLRPEILTLLWIPEPDWLTRFGSELALCHTEYAGAQAGLQPTGAWPAREDAGPPDAFRNGRGTVAGTACIAMGTPLARRLISARAASSD